MAGWRGPCGWKGRIGIIRPSDTFIDDEFWTLAPEGVSIVIDRISPIEEIEPERAIKQGVSEEIEHAAKLLASAKVNCIAYSCTMLSFIKGVGYDKEVINRITKASGGIVATTATTAMVRALKTLGLKKIAVGTPYTDEVNIRLKKFLESSGFKVVSIKGLQHADIMDISSQPPSVAYQLGKDVDRSSADGVFLSCTAFRTVDILQELEEELKKPVVSATQATVWDSLRLAGIKSPVKGYGKLMEI